MMVLAEKSFDGCNSIVYFVITIKGTGKEPKTLRWMAFSFSNLMAFFFFSFCCQSLSVKAASLESFGIHVRTPNAQFILKEMDVLKAAN